MRVLLLVLPALALSLGLLELRLRTTSAPMEATAFAPGESLRVLALGDSITRGIDLEGGSYPRELQQLLWRKKIKMPVEVVNAGVAGQETAELARTVGETLDRIKPHVVITMIGMADLAQLRPSWGSQLRVLRFFGLIEDQWRRSRWRQALHAGEDDTLGYTQSFGAQMRGERNYKEAIRANLEVLQRQPNHQMAHQELGQICRAFGKLDLAEMYFLKAIALGKGAAQTSRRYPWAYVLLLMLYEDTFQWEKARQLAEEIERVFPDNLKPHDFLADLYRKQGKEAERERVLAAGVRARPGSARYRLLYARVLAARGKDEEARRELERGRLLEKEGEAFEASATAYRELSEVIRQRGILHLAMQYPLLDASGLRKKLGEESGQLLFVENKENFELKMRGRPFSDFFVDDFGGTFGHMTAVGNSLVAEAVLARLLPWLERHGLIE